MFDFISKIQIQLLCKLIKKLLYYNQRVYLKSYNMAEVLTRCFRKISEQDMKKVIHLVCEKGLWEHLDLLLEQKISPDCCPDGLLEAGFYGHYEESILYNVLN